MKNILVALLSMTFSLSMVITVQKISMLSDVELLNTIYNKEFLDQNISQENFSDRLYSFSLLHLVSGYFSVIASSFILFFVVKCNYKLIVILLNTLLFLILVRFELLNIFSTPLNWLAARICSENVVFYKISFNLMVFLAISICSLIAVVRVQHWAKLCGEQHLSEKNHQ
jgi:hypothetical protein